MVHIIGGGSRKPTLSKDQLLYDEKIQSYDVVGESAHFMKRQKPLVKVGVYCGRFAQLTAKDAVFLGLCRQNCDLLVVLVDSDYAVRLKGEKEDTSAKERAFLVASLPFVDWVCMYDDSTPEVALTSLNPDFIFTGLNDGDDYGIRIKRDKMVRVDHPFEDASKLGSGKFFNV